MSQPTFVTHYMVRRPKAGNPAAPRPFEERMRHGARTSGNTMALPSRVSAAAAVRRAG